MTIAKFKPNDKVKCIDTKVGLTETIFTISETWNTFVTLKESFGVFQIIK